MPESQEFVPTFIIEGQPYVLSPDSPALPPELASRAINETQRHYWRYYSAYHAQQPIPEEGGAVLTENDWLRRASELSLGLVTLGMSVDPELNWFRLVIRVVRNLHGFA